MSCLKEVEYKIVPNDSYKVIRNCGKCGCKTNYINTNHFRINANGNKIDVWLIYQCEKCKHSYNMTIYERVNPSTITQEEYKKFMANDQDLALEYGNKKELFTKNRAQVDWNQSNNELIKVKGNIPQEGDHIVIDNPYELRLRVDKVLAEILNLSRTKIKELIKSGCICCEKNDVGKVARVILKGDPYEETLAESLSHQLSEKVDLNPTIA